MADSKFNLFNCTVLVKAPIDFDDFISSKLVEKLELAFIEHMETFELAVTEIHPALELVHEPFAE